MKRSLELLLYSNIFISACAGAFTVETYLLLHEPVDWLYVSFIAASTLAFYDLPSLFFARHAFSGNESERLAWIRSHRKTLAALLAAGLAADAMLVFFFPLQLVLCFLPVAAIAFAYFIPQTHLRKIAGLKAGVITLVWVAATTFYPLLMLHGYAANEALTTHAPLLVQNFLFILPLCIVFNVRDMEADRAAGVKTIPLLCGLRATKWICIFFLMAFIVVVIACCNFSRASLALIASAAVTAGLTLNASPERNDHYYSFWIDGMILLQAVLVMLNSITSG